MNMVNLVANRDFNEARGREDAGLRWAANGGESLSTEGASRLVLGPFHDADEAKKVIATINLTSD